LLQDFGMTLVHFLKQRLQTPLAKIPLAHTETDTLAIKIPGQAGKAIRRRLIGFKRTGQRQAAMSKGLVGNGWGLDFIATEKRSPCLRSDVPVNQEPFRLLKRPYGNLC